MASLQPVVLVTGAAGGIGSETVRILLEDCNARVVATDIVPGKLTGLKETHGDALQIIVGDIIDPGTSEKAVGLALQQFGQLDGLCLLAGVFGPCYRLDNSDLSAWTKAMQINVLSHLNTLRFSLPELRRTKGRIVAATSGAGVSALFGGWGFYGMSKAAIAYEMKQIALEEPAITAVGISPGLCDTDEGQTAEDVEKYLAFVSQIDLITPAIAGEAYARGVTAVSPELSGLIVDYNDHRLPISDARKAAPTETSASGPRDYSQLTKQ